MLNIKPPVQSVSIYARGGKIILCALDETVAGYWVQNGCIEVFSCEEISTLGERLLEIFPHSQQGLPVVQKWGPMSERMGPIFKAAGVRSYKQFVAGAKCVNATKIGSTVKFEPTRNQGAANGFSSPSIAKPRSVATSDPEFSAVAIAALADAE